MVHYGRTQDL